MAAKSAAKIKIDFFIIINCFVALQQPRAKRLNNIQTKA
jgi:hypothetical protein